MRAAPGCGAGLVACAGAVLGAESSGLTAGATLVLAGSAGAACLDSGAGFAVAWAWADLGQRQTVTVKAISNQELLRDIRDFIRIDISLPFSFKQHTDGYRQSHQEKSEPDDLYVMHTKSRLKSCQFEAKGH
jgi:hypothetical protein